MMDEATPSSDFDISPEELANLKKRFLEEHPKVSRDTVNLLWLAWNIRHNKQPLFETEDDNLALILQAKAYGLESPNKAHATIIADILSNNVDKLNKSLKPEPLIWGPGAALSEEIKYSLDSSIMHVWVFEKEADQQSDDKAIKGSSIHKILVIGKGIPGLSEFIYNQVFQSSLRIQAKAGASFDILNEGIQCVQTPGAVHIAELPYRLVSDLKQSLDEKSAKDAEGELRRLLGFLSEVEYRTGLIRIHTTQYNSRQTLEETLRNCIVKLTKDSDVSAYIWRSETSVEKADITRYFNIPGNKSKSIGFKYISLHGDLLYTRDFRTLLRDYGYIRIKRVMLDIFYTVGYL